MPAKSARPVAFRVGMAPGARAPPSGLSNLKMEIRPKRRNATLFSSVVLYTKANSVPVFKPLVSCHFLKAQGNL
jgi:hypothetical protein